MRIEETFCLKSAELLYIQIHLQLQRFWAKVAHPKRVHLNISRVSDLMQYKWSQFGFEPLTQLIEWLGWVFSKVEYTCSRECIYVVLTTLPGRMNAVLCGRRERDKLGTR